MTIKSQLMQLLDDGPVVALDVATELGITEHKARAHLSEYRRQGLLREIAKVPLGDSLCTLYGRAA
jgi:predicted ArsR family transcriptional regulator